MILHDAETYIGIFNALLSLYFDFFIDFFDITIIALKAISFEGEPCTHFVANLINKLFFFL